jgi:alpha-1,2-mannosyltransferase
VWSVRRILKADQPTLALVCVALFGLVVSPVSWSHHWVWALPAVLVTAVLGYRERNAALAAVSVLGIVLMVCLPYVLLPEHHESAESVWRQLVGGPYLWWALAVIAVSGAVAGPLGRSANQASRSALNATAPVPATS